MSGIVPLAYRGPAMTKAALRLPWGATLESYTPDDYDETTAILTNRRAPNPPNGNWVAGSRRALATKSSTTTGTVTVTDLNATGPTGKQDATTFVATAGTWQRRFQQYLPTGEGTLWVRCKRGTGSNQTFEMGLNSTSVAVKTATDTWQWLGHTSTRGAAGIDFITFEDDAGAAANILIDEVVYILGTTTPTYTDVGHTFFGSTISRSSFPYYNAGVIDCSKFVGGGAGQSFGFCQTEFDDAAQSFSFISIVKLNGYGNSAPYRDPLLGSLSGTDFALNITGNATNGKPLVYAGGVAGADGGTRGRTANGGGSGPYNLVGFDWHAVGGTFDGTELTLWIDDVRTGRWAMSGTSAFNFCDLLFNTSAGFGTTYISKFSFGALAAWKRALTYAEYRRSVSVMKARLRGYVSATPLAKHVTANVDSITHGNVGFTAAPGCTQGYMQRLADNANPKFILSNWSIPASTLIDAVNEESNMIASLPPVAARTGRKFIYWYMDGNDIVGGGPLASFTSGLFQNYGGSQSAYLTACSEHLDRMMAAGFYVVLCDIGPRTTDVSGTPFNTYRDLINTERRTWEGTHCDLYIPFADESFAQNASASDTSRYPDGIHHSDLVAAEFAAFAQSYLDGIV